MSWNEIKALLLRGTSLEVIELKSPEGEPLIVTFTGGPRTSLTIKCKGGQYTATWMEIFQNRHGLRIWVKDSKRIAELLY
jgi:hypothetical protein